MGQGLARIALRGGPRRTSGTQDEQCRLQSLSDFRLFVLQTLRDRSPRSSALPSIARRRPTGSRRISVNRSLAEYHVPVNLDVPEIEVIYTNTPDEHAPLGARGVGEIGITGVAAGIANAVLHATGKRVRDLPITLDKLL